MIKGDTRERLKYAEYVRDTAIYVEDIFLPLRTSCELLSRFYRIQSLKRDLSAFEIAAANLASLTAHCSCHIGSLLYIWAIYEGLPNLILNTKPLEPHLIVSLHEISELFLKYPKTVLEATLLRSKISYGLLSDGIKAYSNKNSEGLTNILSSAEISSIWPSYMLLAFIDDLCMSLQNTDWLNWKETILMIEGHILDITNAREIGMETDIEQILAPRTKANMLDAAFLLERLHNRLEAEDSMVCKDLIGASIAFSRWLYEIFKSYYGEYEPIVETMTTIISNDYFIGISEMYANHLEEERIEGYFNRLRDLISIPTESSSGDSELSNEATEITLMRFFDDMLVFNGQKRIEFINKYVKNLSEFYSVIDKTIALYSFASLFYPSVPKLGRYSKDQVSPATRLMGGIQWKTDPKDEKEVIDMLITLNPAMINSLKPCKEETLSPARRMDYLVKLYCDKSDRYSWIKDFIEDYWPRVAREEFERKYKIKK